MIPLSYLFFSQNTERSRVLKIEITTLTPKKRLISKAKKMGGALNEDDSVSKPDLGSLTLGALEVLYRNWLETNETKYPWHQLRAFLEMETEEFDRLSDYWVNKDLLRWHSNNEIATTATGIVFLERTSVENKTALAPEVVSEWGNRENILEVLKREWDGGGSVHKSFLTDSDIEESAGRRSVQLLEDIDAVDFNDSGTIAITTSGIDLLEELKAEASTSFPESELHRVFHIPKRSITEKLWVTYW